MTIAYRRLIGSSDAPVIKIIINDGVEIKGWGTDIEVTPDLFQFINKQFKCFQTYS